MAAETNNRTPEQIAKGTILHQAGDSAEQIYFLKKGRISLQNGYSKVIEAEGSIIGVADLFQGTYGRTAVAETDCLISIIPIDNSDHIPNILNSGKEYVNAILSSLLVRMRKLEEYTTTLRRICEKIYDNIMDGCDMYNEECGRVGIKPASIEVYKSLEVFQLQDKADSVKIRYYESLGEVPQDIKAEFFSHSEYICMFHIQEMALLIKDMETMCEEQVTYIRGHFSYYLCEKEPSLYMMFIKLALEMSATGDNTEFITDIVKKIIMVSNKLNSLMFNITGTEIIDNKKRIAELYEIMLTRCADVQKEAKEDEQVYLEYSNEQVEKAFQDTSNSLKKIVEYSGIEKEKADKLISNVEMYGRVKDKFTSSQEVTTIRLAIMKIFYELYEKVFFKYVEDASTYRVIDMFLEYGFLDEKLLEKDQIIDLYYLPKAKSEGRVQVYTIKDWLTAIYKGKVLPSKNEFDIDYIENLREMKKERSVSPEDERQYLSDYKGMVQYEINNMFRSTHRLCNGIISTFVPMLHKDMFNREIKKSKLNTKIINEAIEKIVGIDFSAFYREALYSNSEKKIANLFIMSETMPRVILMPTFGTGAQMWQEIEGRRKDSPARFTLPLFAGEDVELLMIRLMGRFRWEMCRRMQGHQWNDVTQKSLTSVYADYIQYYRKNKDLSDVAKEKLKVQIQRGRNNLREIFTMDYEIWIRYSAQGGLRLNKVARDILYNFCPLSKDIRNKLAEQPLFAEMSARYERVKDAKVKELTNRYTALTKNNVTLDQELKDNLAFYKDN